MRVTLEERDLHIAFSVSLATIGLVFLVQHVASTVSRLPSWFINLRWHYISLICLPVCLLVSLSLSSISWFLVSAGAGLALVSGVRTWERGATTFLFCFLLAGQCLEQLSHTVHVTLPPKARTWTSRYRGQIALWPTGEATGPEHLLVMYNDVTLTRQPCSGAVAGTIPTQAGAVTRQLGMRRHTLVSFATNTRIGSMESCLGDGANGGFLPLHQVALLGESGRLEDVTLRCGLPSSARDGNSNGKTFSRCLTLDASTTFENVTVEFYADGNFKAVVSILHADKCADALSQLQAVGKSILKDEIDVLLCLPSAVSHRFSKLVGDPTLVPTALRAEVPYFFRCVWYLPMAVRNIPEGAAFIADRVVIPIAATVVANSLAFVQTIIWTCWNLMPDVLQLLEDVGVFVTGAYCRAVKGTNSTLCAKSLLEHAEDQRFQLGVRSVDCVFETVRLVLDALELVPGLWRVLLWTLRAEWHLVLYCLNIVQVILTVVVRWPLQTLYGALQLTLSWMLQTLSLFFLDYDLSRIGDALCSPLAYLYRLQKELLAAEAQAAWGLLWWFFSGVCRMVNVFFATVCAVCNGLFCVVSLYTGTTFCTHSFVALIQTAIVLIAMRNELHDIATRDGTGYTSFVGRWPGGKYMVMLTLFAKLHSVVLLRYTVAHTVLIFTLFGLSVVGVLSKLYNLTLYIAFPWVSTTVFLEFFTADPRWSTVAWVSAAKGLVAILLDRTIGDFTAYLVGEVFFVLGVVFTGAAFVWGCQKELPLLALRVLLRLPLDSSSESSTTGAKLNTTPQPDVGRAVFLDDATGAEMTKGEIMLPDVVEVVDDTGKEEATECNKDVQ
ncbi:hypothetical protein, conserved [Trypanosoma brucei gambiense DAL972]|uniref:Transmembrane protein n=2 Tax=Trypanosoma brucei TaxID=5691 RepID=C9ZZH2_TRYB9|nr:hypothetical protein, conserved [Trypanosoma brucei gambiense DAL972]RHW70138.1 hypothetical protein DPX39_090086200 [Trypanosoma brucei equiperdum]CBH14821.1 hypothetical protein, conserved [Trypanosoma brucei gambiense DAL972]|eukprot:XP_011777087.1 hypothetical protein, conserved [Trypanosoma brucei gambiense DAL972]